MSKLTKVLSILLAMVMLFSTVTIGVEAAYKAYKDSAIIRYDSIDRPILTTEQYASMAMDEVDRMLGEANQKIDIDIGGFLSIKADFTSVDKALDSVADLYSQVKSMLSTIGGDIQNLDFSALVDANNAPKVKRGTAGKTDIDIFLMLLEFLDDNSAILAKVPRGSAANGGLDLGIVSSFVDLGDKLNVPEMVKKMIAKIVWPDSAESALDLSKTLDEYVEIFIEEIANGDYAKFKNAKSALKEGSTLLNKYVPGLIDEIDLLHDSVYDILNKGVKIMLNAVAIPYANPRLLALIGRFCGFDYYKTKDEDGDTIWVRTPKTERNDKRNALADILNWSESESGAITGFKLTSFPVDDWGDDWVLDHVNDILGTIVLEAFNPTFRATIQNNTTKVWDFSRGNDALVDNMIAVAKVVLPKLSEAYFADYLEVLTVDQMNALSKDQFIAYVLRTILNAAISFVHIQNTCTTTVSVLFELVRQLAAVLIPSQSYYNKAATVENTIQIGLDMAAYGLNGITNMDLPYGSDADEFPEPIVEWAIDNYGGFLETIDGNDAWEKMSYILFNIIPANWLATNADGSERENVYDLIFTDVLENVLNFDLAAVLHVLDKNPDGELNGTIIEVVLARLTSIVNFVLPNPAVFPDTETYNNLDMLLGPELLGTLIENLVSSLYDRAQNGLLTALLPVVCSVLDLSDPESFGYPYISLEDQHTAGQALLTSFYMYNGSSGLNTNATDKYGNKTQDKLYTYEILSVTTNNAGVSVSPNANITLNGGTSQTFNLSGLEAAENSVLKVTITYNVKSEKGTVMTKSPLTATTYTYIYDTTKFKPDDEKDKADATGGNKCLAYYKPTTYLSAESKLGELSSYSIDMQRDRASDSTTHQKNAKFSVNAIAIDPNLKNVSANTSFFYDTVAAGGVKEFKPYIISAANASSTIPVGSYTNDYSLVAEPTQKASETISFSHSIFVYDDFGLSSLLRSAVNADRQRANYGTTGSYTAEYPVFGSDPDDKNPDMNTVTVTGNAAWNRYTAAVNAAAAIIYAPKQISTMQNFVDNNMFEETAIELYEATKELDACSVSGGTANIKTELEKIVAPDTYVDANGNEVEYEYDETGYPFFGREDYVNYTYENFKKEMKTARNILNDEKEAIKKGKEYQIESIRAAYVAHRVSLYGERLIRVKAYKTHLQNAIDLYQPTLNAGRGTYDIDTWNDFTRAFNFANQVNNEAIGTTVSGSVNLAGDGLRQSKVNEARKQLVKAAKRLAQEKPQVDYAELKALMETVKPTYDAGISNWTETTWNAFKAAYDEAVRLVKAKLPPTEANQKLVNDACDALEDAYNGLKEPEQGGKIEYPGTDIAPVVTPYSDFQYLTGLDLDYINVSDFAVYDGAYTVEVELNEWETESTGAVVRYLKNGEVFAEYVVVVYGDINGDVVIDGMDITELANAIGLSGLTTWENIESSTEENAYAWSADLNHDAVLDGMDISLVADIIGFAIIYNQAWASEEDEIYFDV